MIRYTDECVGCHRELGCVGSECRNRHVPHFICDKCKNEVNELYWFDDKQMCFNCIMDSLEEVTIDDE